MNFSISFNSGNFNDWIHIFGAKCTNEICLNQRYFFRLKIPNEKSKKWYVKLTYTPPHPKKRRRMHRHISGTYTLEQENISRVIKNSMISYIILCFDFLFFLRRTFLKNIYSCCKFRKLIIFLN